MIKRFFGVIATLGVVALVVFTALGAGSYTTMLPAEFFTAIKWQSAEVVEQSIASEEPADSDEVKQAEDEPTTATAAEPIE